MNKFEKYCWKNGVKDSLWGNSYKLMQQWIIFIKCLPFPFNKLYPNIKDRRRVMDFMGIYK